MTRDEAAALGRVLEEHRPRTGQPANLLRTLLAVEQALGYVPGEALTPIAHALEVTEAEVAGVLSYYPDLHRRPRGRHTLRLCLGEACVANRSARLLNDVQQALGIGVGETSSDGRVTVERVYCLGNCGVGPTVMLDDRLYGRVTSPELKKILDQLA
jgi:NADH:ubiquinone oxidoreductase subunit E